MQIGDKVKHVFGGEVLEGKVIGMGFGIFRGKINVLWNDGRSFHHKPEYLKESA